MSGADAIVIGAGPAGLACATALKQAGLEPVLLEKSGGVGASWRLHYDRLQLHTDRAHSGLPGLAMPSTYPRYPARAQVVDYLERYADHFGIRPRFDTTATRAVRENGAWLVESAHARAAKTYRAPALVVATGFAAWPFRPVVPGEDRFGGDIRHSRDYRNPAPYAGKRVLVVGFGNSGSEIALDLADAGISVALAVRSPVNIVPRDLLGMPILSLSILTGILPPRFADLLNVPFMYLAVGSLARLGLRRPKIGPLGDIRARGRVPVLDFGTVAKIREGAIAVRPGVRTLDAGTVEFADGRREPYDAVILATGFRPDLRPLLPDALGALDAAGMPKINGAPTGVPGLYFCGFFISPTGQLREIGLESRRIAAHIAKARQLGTAADQHRGTRS